MNWFLIGFSGCGKTTLGKRLAESLGYDFTDLDTLIEQREKQTIADIFGVKGEPYFRNCESFYLKHLPVSENRIIATGGGTPCFNDNIGWMKLNGKTIYLKTDEVVLFNRLSEIKNNRPLIKNFNNEELKNYVSTTLNQRERYYLKSNYIIESRKSENSCLEELLNIITTGL